MQDKIIAIGTKNLSLIVGYSRGPRPLSNYQDPETTFSILGGHYTPEEIPKLNSKWSDEEVNNAIPKAIDILQKAGIRPVAVRSFFEDGYTELTREQKQRFLDAAD